MQSYNIPSNTLHRENSFQIWRIYHNLLFHISFYLQYFFIRVIIKYIFALKIYIISLQPFIYYLIIWIFNAAANLQFEYHGSEINAK